MVTAHLQENWSRWSGLNRRPTLYESVALPLSYIGERDRARIWPATCPEGRVVYIKRFSSGGKSKVWPLELRGSRRSARYL